MEDPSKMMRFMLRMVSSVSRLFRKVTTMWKPRMPAQRVEGLVQIRLIFFPKPNNGRGGQASRRADVRYWGTIYRELVQGTQLELTALSSYVSGRWLML